MRFSASSLKPVCDMVKIYTLLLLLPLLLSCTDNSYDADRRFLVDMQLVGRDGNPIVGKKIFVASSELYKEADTVASDVSDASGRVRIVFPYSYEGVNIGFAGSGDYQRRVVRYLNVGDFNDFTFPMTQLVLFRKDEVTTLQIIPQQQTAAQLTAIQIEAPTSEIYLGRNPFTDDYAEPETFYSLIKNTEIIIHYTLTEGETETQHTTPLAIGSEPVTHTLAY